MKRLFLLLILLWGGGGAAWWHYRDAQAPRVTFRTVRVERADLMASVEATGTLEPEEVVDVGAQVAGQILGFGADPSKPGQTISYGSRVEEGTVLARLDDALFRARVRQAHAHRSRALADVQKAEAKARQAGRELDRQRRLQNRGAGLTTQQDHDNATAENESALATLAFARSEVDVAEAEVQEAETNLGYTTIRSPVRGVILDRRVNIGQTVVASLNAPSLFLIAKDLRRMEIWASINESDIGSVRVGQPAQFTVGARPGETFSGRVIQIRLNASMVQSVVTYTVVISVDNDEVKLLPYLTARIQFEVARRTGVLAVPTAALRWRPRPEELPPGSAPAPGIRDADREGTLWVRDGDFVRPIAVKLGLSDGARREVSGEGLSEGSEVVVGAARPVESDPVSAILPYTSTPD